MMKFCQKVIDWSFPLLFFLVPLVFYSGSSELFEYNKMMLTYGFTVVILAAWLTKLILLHGLNFRAWLKEIRRTPLDLPILFYLLAHILSTIFSIDMHTSFWGYYSRFHEGLLATISYIILYYAAVSNLNRQSVMRIIISSFISAIIVTFWGLGEHFGTSLSCVFITGQANDTCWIQDVKNRVFATLGQPNWMAAYLDVLIIVAIGLSVQTFSKTKELVKQKFGYIFYAILAIIFFAGLLVTKSRSGVLGLIAGLTIFFLAIDLQSYKSLNLKSLLKLFSVPILVTFMGFLTVSAIFGLPFSQIEKLNLESFLNKTPVTKTSPQTAANSGYIDIGISESGDIRKIVWTGAIKIWQRYPIFGSGVETFAYAYYKDRPVAHNMTSEWDFLYNKAHNEFLNILATTGTVGMIAYLSILAIFSWWTLKFALKKDSHTEKTLVVALYGAWISILVTNFFGFSVVIIGLFFFLTPAFAFLLTSPVESASEHKMNVQTMSNWIAISLIGVIALLLEWNLLTMWRADKSYGYGKNLQDIDSFVAAYPYLVSAVELNPTEPTFRDALSYNEAYLAVAVFEKLNSGDLPQVASMSATEKANLVVPTLGVTTNQLVQKAIADSDQVITTSPNAVPFWRTRTKVFYQLGSIDQTYFSQALESIKKAAELAPTDAKIHYNLGLLLAQNGYIKDAITAFEQTTQMKSDYRDAYYALGLYYNQIGEKEKARQAMTYIVTKIGTDKDAEAWLQKN